MVCSNIFGWGSRGGKMQLLVEIAIKNHQKFPYQGGKNSVREKFGPNPYFAWKKLLSHPVVSRKIQRLARSAGKFWKYFACNWSLCVGKIQQSLNWLEKILSQSLKGRKNTLEIWDKIFPTRFSRQNFFSLRYNIANGVWGAGVYLKFGVYLTWEQYMKNTKM